MDPRNYTKKQLFIRSRIPRARHSLPNPRGNTAQRADKLPLFRKLETPRPCWISFLWRGAVVLPPFLFLPGLPRPLCQVFRVAGPIDRDTEAAPHDWSKTGGQSPRVSLAVPVSRLPVNASSLPNDGLDLRIVPPRTQRFFR